MDIEIRGVLPALLTPFDAGGRVDFDRMGRHVEWLIGRGIAGLFVGGTTGEGLSQTVEEREEVAAFLAGTFGDRVPLIVHVGHPALPAAERLARHAAAHGARAVSAVAPIYYRTTIDGVRRFSEAVAAATDLPFLGYHIPELTHFTCTAEAYERTFFSIPRFAGLKFSDADHFLLRGIAVRAAGRIAVFCGIDEMALSGLLCGACGLVGSNYNVFPEIWIRLHDAYARGAMDEANRWMARGVRIVEALAPFGPVPGLKAALRLRGLDAGDTRPPFPPVDDALVAAVGHALEGIEID